MKIANIDRESFQVPCQVPRWDVPPWLPRSIILLKLLPRFEIMPPQLINGKIVYPVYKETSSPVIFQKLLLPTELE